jgi:hypothetical protein
MVLLALEALHQTAFAVTDRLDVGLRKCAAKADQAQRLACFDDLAASLPKIEADKFGMTAEIDQKRNAAKKTMPPTAVNPTAGPTPIRSYADNDDKADTLTARIVSVRENGRGLLIFALDNEQVWIQEQPSPSIRFAMGETVRIEHGALTSLWLTADRGRKTRVKRLS